MKNFLMGSVALVGAMGLAGASQAAENLQLDLSGFYVGAMAYVDQDSAGTGTRDYSFGSDSEIHFTGVMTLDNGLQVGFHAEGKLEEDVPHPQTGGDDDREFIEETFIFFEGAFGRVEFGKQDGVGDQMALYAPTLFRGNTVNDAELDITGINTINTVSTINNGGDDFSNKIIYFTPRIAGFQAGVSFAPEVDTYCGSAFCSTFEGTNNEVLEVGVTYFGEFDNDVSLGLSATYLTADEGSAPRDIESWSIGANIGFGNFTIGGSYKDAQDINLGVATSTFLSEYEAWDVGVTYENGPWGFMLSYAENEASDDDVRFGGASESAEVSAVQAGVDYMLGAGVSLGGGIQYVEGEADFAFDPIFSGGEDEATVVFLETMVSF